MNVNRMRKFFLSPACWFWTIAAVTVVAVFWEPLSTGLSIWGPDSSTFGHIQHRYSLPAGYLGWWNNLRGLGAAISTQPMNPYHLIKFLVPPSYIRVAVYMAATLGSILAGVYWLRGRGVRGWPAYLGSLALGLTAHTFSLISAGHDGKTLSWPFCILLLAAVDRAVTRRSLFHFALAGYAAGICYSLQPDLAMLFTFLAGAYGLFLFIRHWPRASNRANWNHESNSRATDSPGRGTAVSSRLLKPRIRYVGRNALGVLLTGVLLLCVSLSSVIFALSVVLPDREALASAVGRTGDTERSEWEFATNWSLPPEEILELVAPCFFGIQTGDSRGPYWGQLGRTLGWEQHRRGLMNLRQHTVYLGVIQIVFAIYAVVWALRRRCRVSGVGCRVSEKEKEHRTASTDDPPPNAEESRKPEVLFWAGALIVSLLLALGRHFPLYRLFYMLPYAASLRAPVKFLHLVEVSAGVLLAFGLEALWGNAAASSGAVATSGRAKKKAPGRLDLEGRNFADRRVWRVFGFGCAGAGLLFLLSPAAVSAREDLLRETWTTMGMADHSEVLLSLARGALMHAAVLFLICAAVFLVAVYVSSPHVRRVIPVLLLLVLAVDLGSVDKRYITVWDEYLRFTPREIISRLEGDKADYRVSLPARGGIYDLWRRYIFPRNWITLLDADNPDSLSPEDRAFYATLGRYPLRLWQLTSTRNVLGPAASLAPITKSPAVETVGSFNVMRDGSVQWAAADQGQHLWTRIRNVLPRAAVYPVAEYAEGNSWTNRLADPTWNPAQSVIVAGTSAGVQRGQGLCKPAEIVSYRPNRVEIAARNGVEGILMLNDRFDPRWEVFLDGKAARLLRCNGVMRGVRVPAGEHRVVFLYRPEWPYFAANMAGTMTLLVWGAALLWPSRRTRTALS